jgi:hypothetical protein
VLQQQEAQNKITARGVFGLARLWLGKQLRTLLRGGPRASLFPRCVRRTCRGSPPSFTEHVKADDSTPEAGARERLPWPSRLFCALLRCMSVLLSANSHHMASLFLGVFLSVSSSQVCPLSRFCMLRGPPMARQPSFPPGSQMMRAIR